MHFLVSSVFTPPANEVWGKVIFLHLSVILFRGAYLGRYPLGRYTPQQVTPWAGTHTPGRYTPLAGTPPRQVHPPGRYTPLGSYTPSNACWDTVNKQAVCILLECIFVVKLFLRYRTKTQEIVRNTIVSDHCNL